MFKIRNEYFKNILTLFTGATSAQVLPFLVSPLLTRLYSPDDFGVLAIFFSLCSIFSVLASGRYELSILLPEKIESAINLLVFCIATAFLVSTVLMIVVIVFNVEITNLLGNNSISLWLYFVPLVVFMMSSYNSLRYFSLRLKDFKSVSISRAVKSGASSIIKILLGFLGFVPHGLMTGEIISHFFGNSSFLKNLYKKRKLFHIVNKEEVLIQAKKYSEFPKYSLPAALSNTLSLNLISVFMSSFFSLSILGHYSLVNKAVNLPLNLIGSSISDAYFQKAAEEKNKAGNSKDVFIVSFKYLIVVAAAVFLILFFAGEGMFAFVFGESWRIAGKYARILSFLVAVRFVAVPLSVTMSVFEKQKVSLFLTFLQLMTMMCIFFLTWMLGLDVEDFLVLFSFVMTIYYIFMFFACYLVASGRYK
ncbi:MAG TPA: oligosaccharide flippase family protein [bacterium]|jgi:O-antigen/teichoic acid export membrane protein|nr:oligosaccharide flippase family protein [bacterium]HOG42627.1 oligosaccharide flippase family protein [bacterium]HQB08943.1 oligosaccharide flippase family protein [bacterium]HQM83057.1 oligosaccharide flippase family protein [bacterium]